MKSILLALLLFVSPTAFSQVMPETTYSGSGQLIFRIVNNTNNYVNCFYRDRVNYFTFTVYPYSVGMWYPVYGQYQWSCQ